MTGNLCRRGGAVRGCVRSARRSRRGCRAAGGTDVSFSGRTYYADTATGETQWSSPTAPPIPPGRQGRPGCRGRPASCCAAFRRTLEIRSTLSRGQAKRKWCDLPG